MREPDFIGPFGKAWTLKGLEPRSAAHYSHIYGSLIWAPKAHVFWSWHLLSVISLCELEGVPPAHKHYPEAEYEIGVLAIDPDYPHGPPPGTTRDGPRPMDGLLGEPRRKLMEPGGPNAADPDRAPYEILMPPDVVVHFHGIDMAQAGKLGELATRACVDGKLVPDSDGRAWWAKTIKETVDHMRGLH